MEESFDKLALEYYLRRMVSKQNKIIAGMCREDGIRQNDAYNALLSKFCSGNINLNQNIILNRIYADIDNNTYGKDLRPYAFFDIDTLYAYYFYLSKITGYSRKGMKIYEAIDLAMKDMLTPNAPIEDNGYYNVFRPVVLRLDDRGHISPLKRLPTVTFEKRYDYYECEQLLNDYLEKKHHKTITKPQENQVVEEKKHKPIEYEPPIVAEQIQLFSPAYDRMLREYEEQQSQDDNQSKNNLEPIKSEPVKPEPTKSEPTKSMSYKFDFSNEIKEVEGLCGNIFCYKRKKYTIVDKKFVALDVNGHPLCEIFGYSTSGKYKIIATIDINGNIYKGPLFDIEGNVVNIEEEGVLEIEPYNTKKANQQNERQTTSNDDYEEIKLFDDD